MPTDVGQFISERLIGEREFIVVEVWEGESKQEAPDGDQLVFRKGTAYVFQVQAIARYLKYEPYTLHDSAGAAVGPLTASATLKGIDFTRLYDSEGEDILRIENNPWILYHYAVSVRQPEIRIYPQIPPAALGGGWEYLVTSEPYPQAGSDYGYVAGREMSDYYDPPASLESLAWKSGENSYNRYGFYNESSEKDINPLLNITGRGYLVHPIMDDKTKKAIVAGPPVGPPRTLVSIGPIRNLYSIPTPSEWDDADCSIVIKKGMTSKELVGTTEEETEEEEEE